MKPSRRRGSFFPRFPAALLIAGQLAWGLPAFAADTLRAGQEAQTHAAGLEDRLNPSSLSAGAEELVLGKEVSWRGFQGAELGKAIPIQNSSGELKGRMVFPSAGRVRLESAWTEKILEPGYPQWHPTEHSIPRDRYQALLGTGRTLQQWRDLLTQGGREPVLLASNQQWDFVQVWGFILATEGGHLQTIRQRYAQEQYPLNGDFWVFVTDPKPRLSAVRFSANKLVAELADPDIAEGVPTSGRETPVQIAHAVSGIPIVLRGRNVSGQIRSRPAGRGVAPHEVTWATDRAAAFSAIGKVKDGRTFLITVTELMPVGRFAEFLIRQEAEDVLLLEGSTGAKQAIFGRGKEPVLIAQADPRSTQFGAQQERPSRAMLVGYEITAGAEEAAKRKPLASAVFKAGYVKTVQARLRAEPGGRLMLTRRLEIFKVSQQRYYDYEAFFLGLIKKANARRPKRDQLEVKQNKPRVKNPGEAIDAALAEHPGGVLIKQWLEKKSKVPYRYFEGPDYSNRVKRQNELREKEGWKHPKIYLSVEELLREKISEFRGTLATQGYLVAKSKSPKFSKLPQSTVARSNWRDWVRQESAVRAKQHPRGKPIYPTVDEAIFGFVSSHPGGPLELEPYEVAAALNISDETLFRHGFVRVVKTVNGERAKNPGELQLIRLPDSPDPPMPKAGAEEWPVAVPMRVIAGFPTLTPDPEVMQWLTLRHAEELYLEAVEWLNKNNLEFPWPGQLFGRMRDKAAPGERPNWADLELALQQVEKETAGTSIPVVEVPKAAPRSVKYLVSAYLADLHRPPEWPQEILVPGGWTLERLQRASQGRGAQWLGAIALQPKWALFIQKMRMFPPMSRRVLNGEVLVVRVPAPGPMNAETLIVAHRERRRMLEWKNPADKRGKDAGPQEIEVALPLDWDLSMLAQVVEMERSRLEEAASTDPSFQVSLKVMDRLTGTRPNPVLTPGQEITLRAYQRLVQHTAQGPRLPNADEMAMEIKRGKAASITAHLREIRSHSKGQRREEVSLPVRSRKEFYPILIEAHEAYNRDHRPDVHLTVLPGQLYQTYVVFQRLSGPETRAPVSWKELGEQTGKIGPEEARRRFRELSRLFRYLGIPLEEAADAAGESVRLAAKPDLEPPAKKDPQEPLRIRLDQIFTMLTPTSLNEWADFLAIARQQMIEEKLLTPTEQLPARFIDALYSRLEAHLQALDEQREKETTVPTDESSAPAAGAEEKTPINSTDEEKLTARLAEELPSLKKRLNQAQLRAIAQQILSIRKEKPYADVKDFLGRVERARIPHLRKKEAEELAGTLDYRAGEPKKTGIRRRKLLWVGAAGGLAAIALGIWYLTSGSASRVIWVFGGHTNQQDFQFLVQELRKLAGKRLVFLMEHAGSSFEILQEEEPRLAERIVSKESLNDPEIRRQLERHLARRQRVFEENVANFRENPARLAELRRRDPTWQTLPLLEYLVEHPEIEVVSERTPLEAVLEGLRAELAMEQASIALFRDNDRPAYFRALAEEVRYSWRASEMRDQALTAQQLPEILNQRPGITMVVSRGASHHPAAEMLRRTMGASLEIEVRQHQQNAEDLAPLDKILRPHRAEFLRQEGQPILPEEVRPTALRHQIWSAVFFLFIEGTNRTSDEVAVDTSRVMDSTGNQEFEQLLEEIRRRYRAFSNRAGGNRIEAINGLISEFAVAWLQDRGRIPPEIRSRISPALRNRTVEQIDQELRNFRAGAEEMKQRILPAVLKTWESRKRLSSAQVKYLRRRAPSEQARQALTDLLKRGDWLWDLLRWIDVYLTLPQGEAMIPSNQMLLTVEWVPVAAYELFEIPESMVPVPVIYLAPGMSPHQERYHSWAHRDGEAFVTLVVSREEMENIREEERSHAVDEVRIHHPEYYRVVRSPRWRYHEFQVRPGASLRRYLSSSTKDRQTKRSMIMEARALLRRMMRGFITDKWDIYFEHRYALPTSWLYKEIDRRSSGPYSLAPGLQQLAEELWNETFDSRIDPIDLRAKRIYPVNESEAAWLEHLALSAQMKEPKSGAEESKREMQSAAPEIRWVVIGPSVAARFAGLEEFAGIERRVLVDPGDPKGRAQMLVQMGEEGPGAAHYYGGLEEAGSLAAMAGRFMEIVPHSYREPGFLSQIEQALTQAGLPTEVIAAGIEALAAGMEELRQAA